MSDKKPVYVIGHRNPDTDSICSALAYANLKRRTGLPEAVAARAGELNAETRFVLDYFQVDAPLLVSDFYPRVRDIMLECRTTVHESDSLRHLGKVLRTTNLRSIIVTDDLGKMTGIVSVSDLADRYFAELNLEDLSDDVVSLHDIAVGVDGEVIISADDMRAPVTGKVYIAAGRRTTISRILGEGDICIVGDREDISILECLNNNLACVILALGARPSPAMQNEARIRGTAIISTTHDTYTAARLINQCIPVGNIMKRQVSGFRPNELLSDIKGTIEATNFRNYPVLDDGRLVGLVSRDNLMVPEAETVILVDHNERAQAVEGIENTKVLEIIDHHRLGGMQTGNPIYIREEPVGCTATIITAMYRQHGVEVSPHMAGLLLSAILSDTVLFKSPTCTEADRRAAEELARLADLDLDNYGMKMLKAGSNVSGMTPMDMAKYDGKEFQLGDYRVWIAQVSVMDAGEVLAGKAELLSAMEHLRQESKRDLCLLMVTDILQESTELLYVGAPKTLIGDAFHKDASGDGISLPGVMSRKKQIVPPLTEAVSHLGKD